ncbi:unnamed protein product, partial [Oppiella nova]
MVTLILKSLLIVFMANIVAADDDALNATRSAIKAMIENVADSSGHVYGAKDSKGRSMDCIKIIANPEVKGFIGVYHSYENGIAYSHMATADNVLGKWTWIRAIGGPGIQGANSSATQPTIAVAEDGGFAVAWEQEPVRHLKFSYYKNWDDLVSGHVSQQYDTPQTLSKCAEGTPHFYYASSTYLDVGHHFYNNCDTDREARGSL